jgi:glycosyltransferase involved in cell wall biosynthesis
MSDPLISIITPSLNRALFIGEAVESVLSQAYPAIEHIVVDGGSTDGTLGLLKRFPHLRVISEPDQGLYDAINKGIQMAHGELIGLLNTDDRFASGAFNALTERFTAHPHAMMYCGGTSYFDDRGNSRQTNMTLPALTVETLPERLTGIPAINSCFFRREVFEKLGFFDLQYKLAADRDFLLRFACAGLPLFSIDAEFYWYRSHPGSLTLFDVWKPAVLDENLRLAEVYAEQNVTASIRRASRNWENRYTLDILGHFLRKKDFRSAIHYFRRITKRHWWWPFYFLVAFPLTIARYFLH